MSKLERFLIFLFTDQRIKTVNIRALKKSKKKVTTTNSDPKTEAAQVSGSLRFRVHAMISYVLAFVLVISLIGLLIYGLVMKDESMVPVLRDILFAVLGYFGGAFSAFNRIEDEGDS